VLSSQQIDEFRRTGHLTVRGVFSDEEIALALGDIAVWGEQFLNSLPEEKRNWYLEEAGRGQPTVRKMDNPVFHRRVFERMAKHPALVRAVQQLIGEQVSVFFSQVFMKPPEVGGKKPIHQDNYYFGPDDPDATLTAWIALDDATTENGCLFYSDAHQSSVIPHQAPHDEPFNLQIPESIATQFKMLPAPVPRGGISFHHGNAPHQSSANRSPSPRRAVALHYIRNDARLIAPALDYDGNQIVKVT
jgi:ectoine hydroxylase-related dioxygenase (phytanoyl-CoA dioxygenase family)